MTFLAYAEGRATSRNLAVAIFVLSMLMVISMASTTFGQQWVKDSYYVQHNFTLTPGGTVVPDVKVHYFAHAWVQEDNYPNPPCENCAVEPAQTNTAWECWPDPTGDPNIARDAFVAPHSVRHTGTGGLTIFPQIGVANIPSSGASATINATVPSTCPYANAEATSYYSVDPFGAGTQITGTIRSEGYAEFDADEDSAVTYAFSFTDITARGGEELLSGEIEWYETVRDSAPVVGEARTISDPIEFCVKDLVTNRMLEGTLLSITWKVLQDYYAGGFTWESGTVNITAPAGEFVYDLTSPYTVQQGYARLRIEGGQVVTSEDNGFLDGVLPSVGTSVPLSFSLVNQTIFNYDLGDFDGHPVDVTLDFGGAGGTGDPQETEMSVSLSGPGAVGGDTIICGQPVTFRVLMTNHSGSSIDGFTNGNVLFSPDGAQWETPTYDTAGGLDVYMANINTGGFSVDGLGADTIWIGGTASPLAGVPNGYDDVVLRIETQFDESQAGKTICIDSSYFPPAGTWKWSTTGGDVYPDWDGPYCYPLCCATRLWGMKYEDVSGNGVKDPGEQGLDNWTIQVFDSPTSSTPYSQTQTANGGYFEFGHNDFPPGWVQNGVWFGEVQQAGYTQTEPSPYQNNGRQHYMVQVCNYNNGPIYFGNMPWEGQGEICGKKFDDVNENGMDDGEPGLAGWTIKLWDGSNLYTVVTDVNGEYCFNNLPDGDYWILESQQSGWTQSYPTSVFHKINIPSDGTDVQGVDFGNFVCEEEETSWDTCFAGTVDNFVGPEPTSPNPGLLTQMGLPYYGANPWFDSACVNQGWGHTFENCWRNCPVISATLCIRLKATGSVPGTDGIALGDWRAGGIGRIWSLSMNDLISYHTGGLDNSWDYGDEMTVCLDLANLPPHSWLPTDILSNLQDGDLDIYIQDDTEVDWVELAVELCCPPPDSCWVYVTDGNASAVFAVDPTTGDRTVISSASVGSGPNLVNPTDIAAAAGGELYVLSINSFPPALFQIDPVSGNRTVISSANVGGGPTFINPVGIAIEGSGDILIVDHNLSAPAVLRVDPATGVRTIVSSATVGAGPNFESIHGIAIESGGDILVVDAGGQCASPNDRIFRVSPVDGTRSIVSSMYVGTGPNFCAPVYLAIETSGDIVVTDCNADNMVIRVDPVSGDRVIVSSPTVGTGTLFQNPLGIIVEKDDNILVASQLGHAVIRVDPVTGDRTEMSSLSVGSGQPFGTTYGLALDPRCVPSDCCIGTRGNIQLVPNCDPSDQTVDITDLTNLIDYLFINYGTLCCEKEADVAPANCPDGVVDIADLTALIDHMFINYAPLPPCDCRGAGSAAKAHSGDVFLNAAHENGATVISLNSSVDIRGLQMELIADRAIEPVKLADEQLELFCGRRGNTVKIGIVDVEGRTVITSGECQLLRLDGEIEIVSAVVSDMNHYTIAVRLNNTARQTLPTTFRLNQNYPNPFNPSTVIGFALPEASEVRLDVYNIVGQRVVTLVNDYLEAGEHSCTWNSWNVDGQSVASGVYFYRLIAGKHTDTRKMMLLK